MYEGFVPTYCPHSAASGRGGLNTLYLPFHGHPGGCYVRLKPRTRRPNPVYSQFYPIHPSVVQGALVLPGNVVSGLLAKNSATKGASGQHLFCQQNHGDRKVSSDAKLSGEMSPQTSPEAASKDDCPCQRNMTGCCAKSAGVCPETKEGCCPASKTPEICTSPSNGKKSSQVWMQPISLQGFAPNEVKVRVADGMVHIHAKAEKSSGPGPCLSRYEMRRTVKLPEDVDQQSVSCVMTPNGSVLLYAPRPALEEKKGKADAVTHQLEEKTEEGKEKEETSALSADSQHSEAAELKPESATEKKDVTSNKTDFAKLAETPFAMMDSNPATEGKNTIPEHAETAPKSLTEMASEVLGMSEKTEHAHPAEEQEKEKMEAANVSPKAEEHDSEESEGYESDNDIETCVMYLFEPENTCSEDFEVLSEGCATDAASVDGDETAGEQRENMAVKEEGMTDISTPCDKTEEQGSTETETPADDTDPTPPIKRNEMTKESTESSVTNKPATESKSPSFQDSGPFCALVPLRGYHPQDLQVQLKEHSLLVSAEREGCLDGMVYTDRTQRRLELPEYVDTASVRCVYREDGVLVVTALPKCAEM